MQRSGRQRIYLLYALFREANAETKQVGTMVVDTARSRLFKVGAVVQAQDQRRSGRSGNRRGNRALRADLPRQRFSPADAVKFLKRKGLAGIHVLPSEEYDEKYGLMGLPSSLLIDREGTVADRDIGRDELEMALKRLLEIPAATGGGA
jgi:hypothetical protein